MKLSFRLSVLSTVLVLAPLALAQHPAPRAITIDDYFQIRAVSDPQLSPDAKWVTYTVQTALLKEDKNEERIWMAPATGGAPVALTSGGNSSSHPRWSPDGKFIAFLSARDEGKIQVCCSTGWAAKPSASPILRRMSRTSPGHPIVANSSSFFATSVLRSSTPQE